MSFIISSVRAAARPRLRGVGQDGSEMIAINVRCLDDVDLGQLTPTPFDGKNL